MRITGLALGLVLLTAAPTPAQVQITSKAILSKTKTREIEVRYPHTGRPAIDRLFSEGARSYAASIEPNKPALNLAGGDGDGANRGWMGFKVQRNDAAMLGILLETDTYYVGHAHGMPDRTAYNFLMPDGRRVFLPELVDGPRGMKKISALAIADLKRQVGEKGIPLRPDILHDIESGAGPYALSYTPFHWLPNELVLDFAAYSLFGYAYNPPVHIPMSAIADVVRSDPRAPSPSFDCGKARSAVEKSICGDVELARLDRDLAARYAEAAASHQYSWVLTNSPQLAAEELAKMDKLARDQRAWQKDRDRTCRGGRIACLTASYRKRLSEARSF